MNQHLELVRAVNACKTLHEHIHMTGMLEGYRRGLEACCHHVNYLECDADTETIYPGRPCCCGVLLDWKPTK